MDSKSRSWVKRAVVVLVALVGLSFSLAAADDDGKIEILWLGQAAMRIKTVSGKVIVTDPWPINNPKTSPQHKDLDALAQRSMSKRWEARQPRSSP
jgi:hypothetical protein